MTVQKGGWDYFDEGWTSDSSGKPAANTLIADSAAITYFWSGAGNGNAPATAGTGAIGADQGGAAGASIFHFTGAAWVDTGATVANLYGA